MQLDNCLFSIFSKNRILFLQMTTEPNGKFKTEKTHHTNNHREFETLLTDISCCKLAPLVEARIDGTFPDLKGKSLVSLKGLELEYIQVKPVFT